MASPQREISAQYLDSQGFFIGERHLSEMSKGIDQVAENTAEILALLKQQIENRALPAQPTPEQPNAPKSKKNGHLLHILPDLPPTVHSSDAKRARPAVNQASTGQPARENTSIPTVSQVDQNQDARKYGIYTGDTVDSTELRDKVRDSKGRFIGGAGESDSEDKQGSAVGKIAGAIKDGVVEAASVSAPQGVDPTLDALHEIGSTLAPAGRAFKYMGRGAMWLFGRPLSPRNQKLPKDHEKHNRKNERQMDRLIDATRSNRGGGLLGGFSSITRLLPLLAAAITAVITGIAAGATVLAGAIGVVAAAMAGWKLGKHLNDKLDESEGGRKFKDTIGDMTARVMALLGNKNAWDTVSANDKADDAARYKDRPENPFWGSNDGVYRFARSVGLKNYFKEGAGVRENSLNTASRWNAGNINGLDDAMTRRLVASTVATESRGGDIKARNKQGYLGRYQAGASWLADAGLIRGGSTAVKKAMAGYKSEWDWAQSGGMTKFLKNSDNWTDGMDYDKYRASAEAQDKSFQIVTGQNYDKLKKEGLLEGKSQAEIAGLLKSAHIGGMGGARAVAKGRTGRADANGTTPRKYFDDIALDKDGYGQAVIKAQPEVSTPPLVLAKAQSATSNTSINKAASDIATSVNDVLSGKAKAVMSPVANKLASTPQNLFAPAKAMAGITAPVLPPTAKPFKAPDVPAYKQKLTSDTPTVVQLAGANDNIPQNIGDRDLAHAITGGLGMRK